MKKINILNNIVIIMIITLITEQFFYVSTISQITINNFLGLIITILIIETFSIILWAIFKNSCVAIILTEIILFILSIINIVKIELTSNPILFSDFSMIGSTGQLMQIAKIYLSTILKRHLIEIIIYIVLLGIIGYVSKRVNLKLECKKRIIILVCASLFFSMFFFPISMTKKVLIKYVYGASRNKSYVCSDVSLQYYIQNGFVAGVYGQLWENRMFEPEGYEENQLHLILENSNESFNEKTWGTPNIIIVFSEAFWDITKVEEVKFNKDVTSNLNKLKEKEMSIQLLSPSYGGLSANVDFELLTGGTLRYFGMGYIPLLQLYNNKADEEIISLVKELNYNNYKTKIVFGKDYYGAKEEFYKLGFNQYVELQDTKENIKGGYVSDEYMTDILIREFEEKNKDEKLFYMSETIQNHMPFYSTKYEEYDLSVVESSLDDKMTETVLAYAQGIYDADQQLGRLYEFIKNYEEPTIVIFMGDHLPYLKTIEGKNVFEHVQYFNTPDEKINNFRKYNTEALIFANFEIELQEEYPKYLGMDLLINYVLNNLDMELSPYYTWLDSTRKQIPASNFLITFDEKYQIYNTEELSEDLAEQNLLREKMQYKFFIK